MNLSIRAEKIIAEKKNVNNDNHTTVISLDPQNLIITNIKYKQIDDKILTLIYEGLSFLLIKRNVSRLINLTFKEFESFLRDDNLTPSSDNKTLEIIENLFDVVKIDLFIECVKVQMKIPSINENDKFMSKLRRDQFIFNEIAALAFSEKTPQFLSREYEFIYYKVENDLKLSFFTRIIEHFYQNVLREEIKLVAV